MNSMAIIVYHSHTSQYKVMTIFGDWHNSHTGKGNFEWHRSASSACIALKFGVMHLYGSFMQILAYNAECKARDWIQPSLINVYMTV